MGKVVIRKFDFLLENKDVKGVLTGHLRELHLPTFRECFEEVAGTNCEF